MTTEKDYTRKERLDGLKAMVAFLEEHEDFDLPESVERGLVRTLHWENRGQLKDINSRAEWFLRHVNILQPDKIEADTDFNAVKYFGGGARIVVHISVGEVSEKTVDERIVQRPVAIEELTWNVPIALLQAGFVPDQEELRKRETEFSHFSRGERAA